MALKSVTSLSTFILNISLLLFLSIYLTVVSLTLFGGTGADPHTDTALSIWAPHCLYNYTINAQSTG